MRLYSAPLICLFAFTAQKAICQTHLLGLCSGVLISNTSTFIEPHYNRLALTGGLTYECVWKSRLSVSAELMYQPRGTISNIADVPGASHPVYFRYNYLAIPVMLKYHLGNRVFGFAGAGIVPAVLTTAKTIAPRFDSQGHYEGDETFTNTKSVRQVDFAGTVELGVGFRPMPQMRLVAAAAFQQSFTTLTTNSYFKGESILHRDIMVSAGVQVAMGNRRKEKPKVQPNETKS